MAQWECLFRGIISQLVGGRRSVNVIFGEESFAILCSRGPKQLKVSFLCEWIFSVAKQVFYFYLNRKSIPFPLKSTEFENTIANWTSIQRPKQTAAGSHYHARTQRPAAAPSTLSSSIHHSTRNGERVVIIGCRDDTVANSIHPSSYQLFVR